MMKKTYLKISIIFMILTVVIISCKKNTTIETIDNQSIEMSENGKEVYNKLVKFKNEIESTHKSSTTLSVDSAEWYAEAYYNVTQGYPDSAFAQFTVDSINFTIAIDENEMVSMESMATLMASIETHLSDLIAQNEDEVAHLVVGDVKISQSSRSTDAIVTVTSGLGIGGSWGIYVPFANEEWYYGETAGRCDIPEPIYSDAGEQLEWRFNSPNPVYVPAIYCKGSLKVITTTHSWTLGKDHPLIYDEWIAGPKIIPCHDSPYWNVYLNYGPTLFYGSVASGGLVPDGYNEYTFVDVFSYNEEETDPITNIEGYRYWHNYQTFYSVMECIPGLSN